jgi:hypothetical protein
MKILNTLEEQKGIINYIKYNDDEEVIELKKDLQETGYLTVPSQDVICPIEDLYFELSDKCCG